MSKLRLAAVVSSLAFGVAFSACVGDDPAAATDGGADSASSTDSSTAADSNGGSDSAVPRDSASADTSSDAPGDGSVWSPKQLPGVSLWLDSAVGVTYDGAAKATSWLDQSGNGNNAGLPASCGGPSRAVSSLNGRDTLAFDGTEAGGTCLAIPDNATLQFGTGDFAVFVVARYSNVPGILEAKPTATFWSKREQASPLGGVWLAGNTLSEAKLQLWQQNITGNQAISAKATLNDAKYHRFGGTRRARAFEVWVDGAIDGTTALPAADDVSRVGRPVFLGGAPELPKGWLSGNVAEMVAIKGTVSAASVAQLDAYFKAKYGL